MKREDGVPAIPASSRSEWRKWLEKNHHKTKSVWLIIYHKSSKTPSVYYDEAVDEALCVGWIDSKPNKRDEESYFLFFSKRNPKSNWSRLNKEKAEQLLKEGKMKDGGLEMIKIARESGTWDALNNVENLVIPEDLKKSFDNDPIAFDHYANFPKSVKRGILEWIMNAKRPETREKRIRETVELASKNIRANQYRK